MKSGPPTPDEEAELLQLLFILGTDEWPSDAAKSRGLRFIRIQAECRRREYRTGYEAGRYSITSRQKLPSSKKS